jgi:hypothetical protein
MWTVRNHWKKVIFSDETKIEIGNNRKVYAWRKVDEILRPECNGLAKCWAMTGHKLSSKMFIYFSLFKLPTTGVSNTKVQRRVDDIRNAEDLKPVVAEIWTSLQLHYIRRLHDSLPPL